MSNTYNQVQSRYGEIAKAAASSTESDKIAQAFGYSPDQLQSLPDGANLGLSCGNPLASASLKPGETVVDLGCGGGLDVVLASRKVGAEGRAIGVDMTDCRMHLSSRRESPPFHSLTPASTVISNCVINLVPAQEKQTVFREIARLLKPGGRLAVSDILARKPLPESIVNDMSLYVGCVAGASQVAEYEGYLASAGFKDVMIVDANGDLNLYKGSCLSQRSCCNRAAKDYNGIDYNEWAGSFKIYAVKP